MLSDLHTGFSRGRSGGLAFPSLSEFSTVYVIHTVKGFGIVNKAEIDVFSGTFFTKSQFRALPFTHYIMSGYQDKILRNNKTKKKTNTQFEETKQYSDSCTAGILEFSDKEFKTMINMLRTLTHKIDNIQ